MYNKKVGAKNEEKHPSSVLNSFYLPVTTVVNVGEAFHISLHMNTYNYQNLENGMKIQIYPLLPSHQYYMYFAQY